MKILDSIKAPISDDLKNFNNFFSSYLKSSAPILNIITSYVLKTKGKQLRPILVFLSAKLFNNINTSTYHAATFIELMHNATLIHDDVVDNSYERRGNFSVNALWKNKVSVLIGDYFLAKGLLLAVEKGEIKLLEVVSEAVKEMSEGELLQIEKARKIDINEELYYKIIRKKTATLFSACTYSGSISAGASEQNCLKMKEMGYHLGMAFQIKDDLFDFNINNRTGKPAGNDIREQKYTLPLIYTLKSCNKSEKKHMFKLLKEFEHNKNIINEINAIITKHRGFEYTEQVMYNYIQKAKDILKTFSQNEAYHSIMLLLDYIVERNK